MSAGTCSAAMFGRVAATAPCPGPGREPVEGRPRRFAKEERPRRVGTMRSARACGRAMAGGIVLAAMLSGNFPFRKPMEMDADWGAAEWMCVWVR